MRKIFEIGGILAAVVLIGFGVAAIVMGAGGRSEVQTALKQQKLTGTEDMTPSAIKAEAKAAGLNTATLELPTCSVAGKEVTTGAEARCFASYMRIHGLEATGGQVYSEMPRYASANGKGTNNEAEALKSAGKAVENPARNIWVTETALSTALNASYMGEQTALFGVVVGIALVLAGLGFGILTVLGALRNPDTVLAFARKRHAQHGARPATSH